MGGLREPGGTSQSLWGYINKAQDTDFGGKTGTSNNHSDAWFMCVSPNIVVGAWVGGEYRSIHFRTGALGQGSRTALPICGYFIQSLMGDPQFGRYHGRFNKPQDDDITHDMYMCDSYYPAKKDTALVDSLAVNADSILLDGEGNAVPALEVQGQGGAQQPAAGQVGNANAAHSGKSEQRKDNDKPREEVIRFDDL